MHDPEGIEFKRVFEADAQGRLAGPMSHRGEGSVYHEKTPPDKQMPGPPGPDPPKASAGRASDPSEGREIERKPVLIPPAQAMPDPSRMRAAQPPPPPPLPGSGFGEGAEMPTQSELAKKMAEAQDTHSLAAHRIVDRLRTTLTGLPNSLRKQSMT